MLGYYNMARTGGGGGGNFPVYCVPGTWRVTWEMACVYMISEDTDRVE